jgi:hypothetical protein
VVTIFLVYVAIAIVGPIPITRGFDTGAFGRLPVSINGRIQPIDSAARLALLQIRGTATVPESGTEVWQIWKRSVSLSATEWLLEALTRPDIADAREIFRISDDGVRNVAVETRPADHPRVYYSLKDLQPRVKDIGERVARASKVKAADRTVSDREWLKLRDAIVVYERLKNSLQPNSFLQGDTPGQRIDYDFGAKLATYEGDLRTAIASRRNGNKDALDKPTEERVVAFVRPYGGVARAALVSFVPPMDPDRGRDRWLNAGTAVVSSSRTGTFPASMSFLARMSTAYAHGNADEFNRQLAGYARWLAARGLTLEVRRAGTESFYNRFQPLARALSVYLVVFVLGVTSMIRRSVTLYRCSAMLLVLAAGLHGTGVMFDMMLQGTLPVTNLYSATICAGGILVLLCAALERRYRNGIGLIAAAILGPAALAGAHGIAPGGAGAMATEAFGMPFWLALATTLLALRLGLPESATVIPYHSGRNPDLAEV